MEEIPTRLGFFMVLTLFSFTIKDQETFHLKISIEGKKDLTCNIRLPAPKFKRLGGEEQPISGKNGLYWVADSFCTPLTTGRQHTTTVQH